MIEFVEPYGYQKEHLQDYDFNRQIVEPGVREKYPNGVLNIYVDDDFFCVASLPLEEYRNKPLPEIVALLWPFCVEKATYQPDHGTTEQTIHYLQKEVKHLRSENKEYFTRLLEKSHQIDRLRLGRTDTHLRDMKRTEATATHHIRQYEHLLVAMAHVGVPMPQDELKGVCSVCDLYLSDRVHDQYWIDKHKAGYPRDLPITPMFEKDVFPDGEE